jgi:hypothetical protein
LCAVRGSGRCCFNTGNQHVTKFAFVRSVASGS